MIVEKQSFGIFPSFFSNQYSWKYTIYNIQYTIVPQWQKEAVMFAKLYVSKKKFNDSTYKKTPNL